MTHWMPKNPVPPGEFIKDGLDERGWTQIDLAEIVGRTARHVNEIINGKVGITPRTARELAAAFDTTPEFWLNLENQYQLSRSEADDEGVSRRAALYKFPIRAMTKRGWIEKTDDLDALEAQLTKFFGARDLDEVWNFRHAAKRSTGTEVTELQLAWLYRVRQIAMSVNVPSYTDNKLDNALSRLETLRTEAREVRHVPRILHECGIRFAIVEAPEGSKIDGVCFWLNHDMPVVGLSMRFDRIDNFWFVLRHELEHVKRRHGANGYVIDVELDENHEAESVEEAQANAAAAEFCAPQSRLKSFIARKQPYISERDVVAFARLCDVHTGLIVGQLHRHLKNYKNFRAYLVSVSRDVMDNALVDGWGQVAPT